MHLCCTGLFTPPQIGGALHITKEFYREYPTRNVRVSVADTCGVLPMALAQSCTFEVKADLGPLEHRAGAILSCPEANFIAAYPMPTSVTPQHTLRHGASDGASGRR